MQDERSGIVSKFGCDPFRKRNSYVTVVHLYVNFIIRLLNAIRRVKMKAVPRPGDNIHIPLSESEALRLMLRVKPTAEMPRPGANPTKAKRKRAKKKA
jgi:hypothetical protein